MSLPRLRRFTLVLSGGGARGAYEAGVLRFVLHELSRRSGEVISPRVVAGSSVGALNGAFTAAYAGKPGGALALSRLWQRQQVDQVYRFDAIDLLRSPLRLFGGAGRDLSLVDPAPLVALVRHQLPWAQLGRAIDSGLLDALVVATTQVAEGRCTFFVDRRSGAPPLVLPYPEERVVTGRLGPDHVLASAAIPFLFPPVTLGGDAFQDGSLRQNTPIGPALRLGARRLLVIGVKRPIGVEDREVKVRPEDLTLTFLLGKALNALMLDPIERDLHGVTSMNAMIRWGTETYGPEFLTRMNAALNPRLTEPVRYIDTVFTRPSEDLGAMAAAAWQSGTVDCSRATRLLLGTIAGQETEAEADLLSYLLFDRAFTRPIEELGFADAARDEERIAQMLGLGGPPLPGDLASGGSVE